MKRTAFILVFFVSGNVLAQDSEALREAAERYEAVAGVGRMLEDTNTSLASRLPEDKRGEFIGLMNDLVDAEGLRDIALDAMAKHFSIEELDALAAFYGSDVGQSILSKFGAYNAEVTPKVMQSVLQAAEDARIRMESAQGQ